MGLIKTLRNIRNGVISAIPLLPNYTQTQYVDDNLPAIESKNLNKAEKQLVTLTNQINANIGTLNTLITNSNANIDKVQKLNSNGDFSQNISLNGSKIYNSGTPTNDNDLATVKYVKDNSGSSTRTQIAFGKTTMISPNATVDINGIDLNIYKNIQFSFINLTTGGTYVIYISKIYEVESNIYITSFDSKQIKIKYIHSLLKLQITNYSDAGEYGYKITGE